MARLTWDNVAPPNFSGVADSYRVMSQLLGNATQSGMDMLNTYKGANAEAADRAILQRMVGIQDPTQFDPNTVIGPDGSRASLATIRGVGDYAGTLLDRAVKKDDRDFTQYGRNRVVEGNQVLDQNADTINSARSLAAAGNTRAALATLSQIPGLRPDQFAGVLGDVDQLATRSLGRDVTSQGLTENRYAFGRQIGNDNTSDQATAVINQVLRTAATPADARIALENMSGDLDPQTFTKAMQGLGGFGYGNIYAPVGGGGGSAGGPASGASGAPLPSAGSQWASAVGLMKNESGGNYAAQNNAVGSGGKRGHFGALQFGQDRLADAKNAGVIPQDMTPEQFRTSGKDVQDKVADWHFSDIDAQAQRMGLDKFYGQNVGGVTINRDSIRGMAHLGGINGVQRFITSGGKSNPADENGTKLSDYGQRFGGQAPALPTGPEANFSARMVDRALDERVGQNNATGISSNYAELASDNRDANQVVESLRGEGGPFAGANRGVLLDYINYIVNNSNGRINPAIASEILSRNTEKADDRLTRATSIIGDVIGAPFGRKPKTVNLTKDVRINDANVYAAMEDYLSGRTSQRTLSNESMGAMAQVTQAAQSKYQSALQQYQAILLDAQTRPGAAANVPRYRQALEQAAAELEKVQTQVAQNENWRPQFNQTRTERSSSPVNEILDLITGKKGPPVRTEIDGMIRYGK